LNFSVREDLRLLDFSSQIFREADGVVGGCEVKFRDWGDGGLELSLDCAGARESIVVSCKFCLSTSTTEENLNGKSYSRLGWIIDPDCRLEANPSPSKIVSSLKGKTSSVSSFSVGKMMLERTSFRELQ